MLKTRNNFMKKAGFTIVELLIVIAVIGTLATITIVGYGAWRNSTLSAAVKSDLNNLISALESKNTFDNAYPVLSVGELTSLDNFTPSTNVSLSVFSSDATSYCIDATSAEDTTIEYYAASETKDQGAVEGTCDTRTTLPLPDVPENLTIISAVGTTVSLQWDSSLNAVDYTAQCAADTAFIFGLQSTTLTGTTTSISGMTPSTTVYCRVKASNNSGSSNWSATVSNDTTNAYGSLAVATSIEGYWTSAPQGFLLEDGSAVSRADYADLFAVIGTTYGSGNGSTTFNLPDSRGRTSVNRNATDSEFDVIGERPGSKTEQLTVAQIPSHTHQVPYLASGDPSDYLGGSGAAYGLTTWAGRSGAYNLLEPVGSGGTHNNVQPSIVKMSAIKYSPSEGIESTLPAATSIAGYWTTAPSGYLLEDGSAISRSTYADLFAVIGTTYGAGNGSTTFNLPDSRGRVGVNLNSSDVEFDTIGEKYGEKAHTLTVAEIPSHTHQVPYLASGDVSDYLGGSGASYGLSTSYASKSGAYNLLEPVGSGGTHNNIQPSIVRTFAIKYTTAAGSLEASPKGTSIQGYWTTAPSGYLLEDGSPVSRSTYAALFSVIGTTYGSGNGSTTFNLPDSRGRIAVNKNTTDTEFDTIGEKYGEKAHTLTVAQIPSHTHQVPYLASGDVSDYLGGSGAAYGLTSWVGRSGAYDMLEPVGGGGAHNNIQPSIVKVFAIKY